MSVRVRVRVRPRERVRVGRLSALAPLAGAHPEPEAFSAAQSKT